MTTPIHSKIINKLASEILQPMGLVRKGQSRIWLDDHGWWVTVIEFQPSGWSKGTYLNVGINWQWYPKESISFDLGHREHGFAEFKNEEQFALEARKFVDIAKQRTLEIRNHLATPEKARLYVLENTAGDDRHIWASLNKGMVCLVTGEIDLARDYLNKVLLCQDDKDWAQDVKNYALQILSLKRREDHLDFVLHAMSESRRLKKLKDMDIDLDAHP